MICIYSGKGKKEDWSGEDSDKELKMSSDDEDEFLSLVIKKGTC